MRVDALPMGADPADRCVQGVSDGLSGAVFGDWASIGAVLDREIGLAGILFMGRQIGKDVELESRSCN